MDRIENRTYGELRIGDTASLTRMLTYQDIEVFAIMSGDVNPAHVDREYAKSSMFRRVVAHGMWGAALISTVFGTELPGPGAVYLDQTLHFRRPVGLGDTVTVTVKVVALDDANHHVTFDCAVVNQRREVVIDGVATILAPTEKISRARAILREMELYERGAHLQQLVEKTKDLEPIRTAVVHPVDAVSLLGAIQAAEAGLIIPVLVGPQQKIQQAADQAKLDISGYDLVSTEHSHGAAAQAVAMACDHEVGALMKGSLHTDELMGAIVDEPRLRTARRISHVFVVDTPGYPKPMLVTDAAVNIYPTLEDKRDIIQNAIDLAHALGLRKPKVAILSAVETISPSISSTLDAAVLCKMAERGQITGGIVDGPLAFDNAVSEGAAKTKGIVSPVAGHADIFVVPDIDAGNMLAKQLEYLADAEIAGIVLGARVPIIVTSRADTPRARLCSCAIALLAARHDAGAVS